MTYNILVREVMTLRPVLVYPDAIVYSTVKKMVSSGVGSVVVVDSKTKKLMGIFTEKDVMKRVILSGKDPKKTKVKDVMTKSVQTIGPWEDMKKATDLMISKNLRRLPVVDNGKLVGIVTHKDMLRVEPTIIDALVERLNIREPGRKPLFSGKQVRSGICEVCSNYSDKLVFSEGMWICEPCLDSLH